ncbi:FabD/lysophospholipase-like protein [Cenococcum geophilum]
MPEHDLRLLALDGGGVRGLSTLQILKQLMDTIDPESPPKPCDYFNMIGGTSTGGSCIDVYVSLSDRIFQKQRYSVMIKGRLERAIKEIVVRQGLAEDALLKDAPDAKCKVFVCVISNETGDMIWEVGRVTSAASSFFDPIIIGDFKESFVDGAVGANNLDIWPSSSLEDKIKCLALIGTGVPLLTPFKDDVIETEKIVERFSRDKLRLDDTGRHFWFNVLRGLEDIGLEDLKRKNAIIAAID